VGDPRTDWIKLEGERKQEKAPGTRHPQQLRNASRIQEPRQFAQSPQ
jgi:hypothetical protein